MNKFTKLSSKQKFPRKLPNQSYCWLFIIFQGQRSSALLTNRIDGQQISSTYSFQSCFIILNEIRLFLVLPKSSFQQGKKLFFQINFLCKILKQYIYKFKNVCDHLYYRSSKIKMLHTVESTVLVHHVFLLQHL